jgi:type III secretion protein C
MHEPLIGPAPPPQLLRRRTLAVWLCACSSSAAWAEAPAAWKESGYAYNAQGTPLVKVLSAFARTQGVELRIDSITDDNVQGMVKTPTAVEFLDRLAARHRFQWFVYNRVLYISASTDATTDRIDVNREALSEAKAALIGVGIFDPKFGWGEMPEQSAVTVSGPREYVRLVRGVIGERDRQDDFEAMVFRLKNASVDDRSITIRGQTLVTPGAATLLKSMLASRNASGGGGGRALVGGNGLINQVMGKSVDSSFASLLSGGSSGGAGATDASNVAKRDNSARSSGGGGGGRGLSIEGDVRTNSIVIYDAAKRRAYYRRLIEAIDQPQHLVEIEACVIDVNREQVSELGFGFDASRGKGRLVIDPTSTLAAPLSGGSTLIVSGLDSFFARLSLMEREGFARIVAKPTVITLENLVAVLDLSQTVFLRATGERVATIEQVTAGMLLRVTPRVVKRKKSTEVHLTVDIEDGKVLPAATSADTPEVQRSTISTQAILLDRQSLIIGGYDTSNTSKIDDNVPGVSKIPFFGALFSGKKNLNQRRQRLFILTPRLVNPTAAPPTL